METKSKKFLLVLNEHKNLVYKVENAYCKVSSAREDLIQEIIIQLWTSFDKYDSKYKLSTWVYRIALNNAISFYRKKEKHRGKIIGLESVFNLKEEASQDNKEEINQLYEFIYELKEIDKALILMHLEKLSHDEIAKVMGITASNVGTRLGRIKTKLLRKFQIT